MQIDERMLVKSLVGSQINCIKVRVNELIDFFYDCYDPVKSLNRKVITDLISNLNDFLYSLGGSDD